MKCAYGYRKCDYSARLTISKVCSPEYFVRNANKCGSYPFKLELLISIDHFIKDRQEKCGIIIKDRLEKCGNLIKDRLEKC